MGECWRPFGACKQREAGERSGIECATTLTAATPFRHHSIRHSRSCAVALHIVHVQSVSVSYACKCALVVSIDKSFGGNPPLFFPPSKRTRIPKRKERYVLRRVGALGTFRRASRTLPIAPCETRALCPYDLTKQKAAAKNCASFCARETAVSVSVASSSCSWPGKINRPCAAVARTSRRVSPYGGSGRHTKRETTPVEP